VSQAREQLETTVRTLSAAKEKDDSLRQTLAKLLPPESEPFEGLQKLLSDSAAALHEAKNLLSLYEKLDKIEERSTILQDSLAKAREELKQTEKAEKAARDYVEEPAGSTDKNAGEVSRRRTQAGRALPRLRLGQPPETGRKERRRSCRP
jgi:chromosome segregation ATPase